MDKVIEVVQMSRTVVRPDTRGPERRPPLTPVPITARRAGTEQRILDAAERCLSRLGLTRLSMGAVAEEAGLSRGSLYLYFGDRTTLIDAVLARAADRFVKSSEEPVRRRRTLAAQVAEAAVFIRRHVGDPEVTLALPGAESLVATLMAVQAERLVETWVAFWDPLLAEAERRQEVRALDRRQAGEWIVRLLLSFAVMPAVSFDQDDPEAVRRFVARHVVKGLAS